MNKLEINSIVVKNLSVTYSNGHRALKDISFSLRGGTICGLVGINGSGKSSLFKAIMGLVKHSIGTVKINGQTPQKVLKACLIAYVPQVEEVDWNFPILVEDLVMMGRYGYMNILRIPKARDFKVVDSALKKMDILDLKKRQIGELSGGQKKRAFLARALAQEAEIILLDEPFNGIDVKTEESIIKILLRLKKQGKLLLVSTHNLGSIPHFCDQVLLINQSLQAAGSIKTVFTAENLNKTFGGMLRNIQISQGDLHKDEDSRHLNVFTDDERALIFYGENQKQKLINKKKK